MKNKHKDILFYIENEVQFESLKPLLIYLRDETKVSFDIVVPDDTSESTIIDKDVHEGGLKVLKDNGFDVIRSVDGVILPENILKTDYTILLSAYIYRWHYDNVKAKYRIMFPYASYYFNKPHWTIKQFIEQDYLADALFSHAIGTKPITDIFTKTYVVPSLKLMDFNNGNKRHKNDKPVLFFAPTYNEIDFAVKFLDNIDDIKKKYTVVMRSHHRVAHVDDNKDVSSKLYQKADKIYDISEYALTDALKDVDVVVSDNSGVIFDAIYCGIPVALFSQNPNSFHYDGINTIQFDLVNGGDVLWTDKPGGVLNIVDKTLTVGMIKRQKVLRDKLFPEVLSFDDPVKCWMDVLKIYLNEELPYEYSLAKKYWVNNINCLKDDNRELLRSAGDLNLHIKNLNTIVNNERNPGVRIAIKRLAKALIIKFYKKPINYVKYSLRPWYRKVRIKIFNDPIIVYQFVFAEPKSINFGDELTKDIVEKLFNKKAEVHNQIDCKFDLIGVGSLIHFFNESIDYKTYVWGSGLIDGDIGDINNNFVFKACRGEYTRSKISKKYRNIPMGDPGLLCNLIYTNKIKKTDKIGVIPHFRDEYSKYLNDIIKKHPEIFKVISVGQAPEIVADEIKSCKLVLSSSLHGLIVSDSLGIPNIHLVLSDNLKSPNHLRGGEYKFRDYYSGVGRAYENFNPREKDLLNLGEYDDIIKKYKPLQNLKKIQDSLIKAFPYR